MGTVNARRAGRGNERRRARVLPALPIMLAGALAFAGVAPPTWAAGDTPTYWYDGTVRRSIQIDEANGQLSTRQDAAPANSAKIKSAIKQGRINQNQKAQLPAGAVSAEPGGSTADPDSMPIEQALPGGVIVTLKQVLPDVQARAFLQQQGLTPLHELGSGSGTWLVESAPGAASVQLANKLYESGQFAGAQPNWYRPRIRK